MAKKEEKIEYVNKKGLRLDGRKPEELRELKITASVLPNADGSCYLEWGQNKVLAGVHGPKEVIPKHMSNPYKGIIKFEYRMATFSVPDRKSPKPGRRDIEISKVCGEALSKAVMLEKFPNTALEVWVEILDSNAGSRVAALTAASVALADAGIPMTDLVCACAAGKAGGKIILDLNKDEEDAPDAVDMPLAVLPNSGEIVLLQMDGILSKKEWIEAMELGLKGCRSVHEKQVKALKDKYGQTEKIEGPEGKTGAKEEKKQGKGLPKAEEKKSEEEKTREKGDEK